MSFFKKLFGKSAPNPYQENITPEFAEQLDLSRIYLNQISQLNQSGWNFGNHKTYHMSQEEGILRFNFEDGTVVECAFQAIGSFSTVNNTWAWAWANPSINDILKVDAERIHAYGLTHEITRLTTPEWPADMDWSWSMTALAARACEASGAYCAISGPMRMFLTFHDVKIIPPAAT